MGSPGSQGSRAAGADDNAASMQSVDNNNQHTNNNKTNAITTSDNAAFMPSVDLKVCKHAEKHRLLTHVQMARVSPFKHT